MSNSVDSLERLVRVTSAIERTLKGAADIVIAIYSSIDRCPAFSVRDQANDASNKYRALTRSEADDTAELAVMSRDECELAKQEVNPLMCPLVIE